MIIGIGTDLTDIRRIEKTLERFGQRFVNRVFTEGEARRSEKRKKGRAASYAKRFAAKEACSKALGSGIRMGVKWREMEVVNLPSGQPTLNVTGDALQRMMTLVPKDHVPRIHLTLTDDNPYAQAFVVIEALPSSSM